jgi:hypothetical protein
VLVSLFFPIYYLGLSFYLQSRRGQTRPEARGTK